MRRSSACPTAASSSAATPTSSPSTRTRRPSARDKHEEFFPKYGASPLFEHHTTSLVFNDPPLHTRVRRLIAGALTPRHIAAMEQRLIERVDSLLD